ncbi:flagellar biosynthetic protein FliO [Chthonobacter albigriseus]|uniref:flagellar biosynthetic protein FliO n=1 Tax=Chthonobacter albigriseus TaxID=1683161 RepID=UPI0015EF4CCC|nr:flagellar biosynthetic protein FliO [Chthonobacter albigriseus]
MQELLVQWFGTSGATAARYVIAFAVVLVLLLALRWILKSVSRGGAMRPRGKQQRLAVMDVTVVDERRRLVLVRRDGVEHLLLVGGPTDIVVEQTIIKGVPVGTMGRFPRPTQEQPQVDGPPPPRRMPAREAPAEPKVAAAMAAAAIAAPEEVPEPAPTVVRPAMPAPEPRRSAPPPPPPVSEQSYDEPLPSMEPRVPAPMPSDIPPEPLADTRPASFRTARQTYAPPVSGRPEPVPAPTFSPSDEVLDRGAAPDVSLPPLEPADDAFDDLALRLDEALREENPKVEPSFAPTPPVAPVVVAAAPAVTEPPAFMRNTRGPITFSRRDREPPPAPEPIRAETPKVEPAPIEPPAPEPEPEPEIVVSAPEPVAPPPPPAPPADDLNRSMLGAASAWFRPRTPAQIKSADEKFDRKPEPPPQPAERVEPEDLGLKPVEANPPAVRIPAVEPETIARVGGLAAVLPAVEVAPDLPPPNVEPPAPEPEAATPDFDLSDSLSDDLDNLLVEAEPATESTPSPKIEPVVDVWKPEPPKPVPAPVPVVPPPVPVRADEQKDPDFTSLEDEMARLLDELAGDIPRPGKPRN